MEDEQNDWSPNDEIDPDLQEPPSNIELCKKCQLTYNNLIQSSECPHWADVRL